MAWARPVEGRYRRLRTLADVALIAVLLALPWIRIGGEPLVLLDIAARKFHLFGLVLFPQELVFLWLVLAILALSLFLFTALLGRLWCGWACPQTVFTDLFAWLERRIQGWRGHAPPRSVAPWRVVATHGVFLAVAAVVALHAVGYFVSPYAWPTRLAAHDPGIAGVWLAALTGVAYADFAFVRQAFCKYLCPYARFQGVLFDRSTLVIAYDAARGEPRGRRGQAGGDCVDCGLCVQVCPSGIDIRNGLQLECIACTHCIDACDAVMRKLDRPRGLIDYRPLQPAPGGPLSLLLRPRTAVYGALLGSAVAAFALLLAERVPVGFEVHHNRGALTSVAADGRLGNAFDLRLENRTRETRSYRLGLEAAPGFELVAGVNPVELGPLVATRARVFVLATPTAARSEGDDLRFVLSPEDGAHRPVTRESRFLLPGGASHGS